MPVRSLNNCGSSAFPIPILTPNIARVMPKTTDIRIKEAFCTFEPLTFRAPLKFGGRIISKTDVMNVQVVVETKAGKKATGLGSMPVGNVWAWPSEAVSTDLAQKAMMNFAEQVCDLASGKRLASSRESSGGETASNVP